MRKLVRVTWRPNCYVDETWFVAVSSIEELQAVVGCKDSTLEESLLDEFSQEFMDDSGEIDLEEMEDWDRDDFETGVDRIQRLVNGSAEELGSWVHHLEPIAKERKLILNLELPFEDSEWSQTEVWEDYIKHVRDLIVEPAINLLKYLEMGRPLKGESIYCDGVLFSWLTNAEIQLLHESLDQIEVSHDNLRTKFHQQLLGTLSLCCKEKCELFMGAT